jgi:ADP-ribosylglycohydrolase
MRTGTFGLPAGCHTFELPAGCHTDDAAQMFLLAETLRSPETTTVHLDYSYFRYLIREWHSDGLFAHLWDSGFRSHPSVGLGGNTRSALDLFRQDEVSNREVTSAAPTDGNGTIMRAAPVAVLLHNDLGLAIKMAAKQAAVTHAGPVAIEMAKLQTYITVKGIQNGGGRDALIAVLNALSTEYPAYLTGEYSLSEIFPTTTFDAELLRNAQAIVTQLIRSETANIPNDASNTLRFLTQNGRPVLSRFSENLNWRSDVLPLANPTLVGNPGYYGAYSLDAMTIALYALFHAATFEELVEYVVHLQGDADTNAAIAGQMAAPYYANPSSAWIPENWAQGLAPHILNDIQWYTYHLFRKGALLFPAQP